MGLERFRHPRNSTSVAKSGRCPSRGVPSTCCVRSAPGAFLPGSLWAMSPAWDRSPPPVEGQPVPLTWHRYSCKLNNQQGGWISVSFLVSLFAFFFLFNSKHLSATNYQLLSTSLFQGEPCWAEKPQGRNYLSQPPTPGLSREDAGTQDLGLVGTGLRAESRPVSLIRRVNALLHWSLARGSVSPALHACLRLPGPAGQNPRRALARSALPTRSVIVTKVAAEQHPAPPPAHAAGLWSGPPGWSKLGRDTGGAETHGRDAATPHQPSGPAGLRCWSAAAFQGEATSRVRSGREGAGGLSPQRRSAKGSLSSPAGSLSPGSNGSAGSWRPPSSLTPYSWLRGTSELSGPPFPL